MLVNEVLEPLFTFLISTSGLKTGLVLDTCGAGIVYPIAHDNIYLATRASFVNWKQICAKTVSQEPPLWNFKEPPSNKMFWLILSLLGVVTIFPLLPAQ